MPINAYTGLMGSGKSYECVSSVIMQAIAKGRRVVTNVDGIDGDAIRAYIHEQKGIDLDCLGSVVHCKNDDVGKADFLPHGVDVDTVVKPGDLVCIDEAWRFWGTDCKLLKEHLIFFREHRHYVDPETKVSCDLVLMVQDISDLHRTLKVVVELSFRTTKIKSLGLHKVYRVEMWEGWNPVAEQLKSEHFAAYRSARLAEGVTPNTINREHAYLRAVFNELIRLGFWTESNPLARLRQFKIAERELSYLTDDQIGALLTALARRKDRDALLITKLCLASAARWNEGESLRISQLHSGMVHFTQTKTDKNRSIPIDDALADEIREFHQAGNRDASGRIFKSAVGAFRMAVKEAGIELMQGQLTHVLRHTFASHFMMNGGNILALQKVLGHSSLQTTMIYAHLSPDHLQEAKLLNPLTRLTLG